ncbi:HAD family hydrolase [Gemmiger sp.]
MRNYDVILFDLDGTLTDSAPGILNSVRYACRKMGLELPAEATLRKFLGPPLIDSFRNLMGLSDADADRAVSAFREYFPTKGIFENEVYPGIAALLADLKATGKTVIIATSKPEDFAKRIMEHFDLARYCDFICGATLDETRTDKAEVIAYALETAGITDKHGVVMVGDREHDVIGAKKNGLPCIGAVYGYGSAEELRTAGAAVLAETVADLHKILLG